MRILGKTSFASFIKLCIDITYYVAILAAGVFTLVTLWLLFLSEKKAQDRGNND